MSLLIFSVNILKVEGNFFMQMTDFCDHLYNESTDGYIQILKLDDENNSGERTIKIYNTKNDGLRDIVEELHKKEDEVKIDLTTYSQTHLRDFETNLNDIKKWTEDRIDKQAEKVSITYSALRFLYWKTWVNKENLARMK